MFAKTIILIVVGIVLAIVLVAIWAIARAASIADAEDEKMWAELSKKKSEHSDDSPNDNPKEVEKGGEST